MIILDRTAHSSFAAQGGIIIMGGAYQPSTAELITADGKSTMLGEDYMGDPNRYVLNDVL